VAVPSNAADGWRELQSRVKSLMEKDSVWRPLKCTTCDAPMFSFASVCVNCGTVRSLGLLTSSAVVQFVGTAVHTDMVSSLKLPRALTDSTGSIALRVGRRGGDSQGQRAGSDAPRAAGTPDSRGAAARARQRVQEGRRRPRRRPPSKRRRPPQAAAAQPAPSKGGFDLDFLASSTGSAPPSRTNSTAHSSACGRRSSPSSTTWLRRCTRSPSRRRCVDRRLCTVAAAVPATIVDESAAAPAVALEDAADSFVPPPRKSSIAIAPSASVRGVDSDAPKPAPAMSNAAMFGASFGAPSNSATPAPAMSNAAMFGASFGAAAAPPKAAGGLEDLFSALPSNPVAPPAPAALAAPAPAAADPFAGFSLPTPAVAPIAPTNNTAADPFGGFMLESPVAMAPLPAAAANGVASKQPTAGALLQNMDGIASLDLPDLSFMK
jgi:hypothetical protein